jgi:hypothetical protein
VGGHDDYGLGPSKRAGFAWDLKIRWIIEGLPGNAPHGHWDYGSGPRPFGWPDGGLDDVVGWLFQHVRTDYRLESNKRWTPDGHQSEYWEMWAVIWPASVVPSMAAGAASFSNSSRGYNDAFCVGDNAIRDLAPPAPPSGGNGTPLIYRKIGKAYFMPWTQAADVNNWLESAHVPTAGYSGGLPMAIQSPAGLPLHGLKRVTAIRYQRRRPGQPLVTKWDELKPPAVSYYEQREPADSHS